MTKDTELTEQQKKDSLLISQLLRLAYGPIENLREAGFNGLYDLFPEIENEPDE